jgi:hypothetical protein
MRIESVLVSGASLSVSKVKIVMVCRKKAHRDGKPRGKYFICQSMTR